MREGAVEAVARRAKRSTEPRPTPTRYTLYFTHAGVAKLVDAPALGADGGNPVEVQVLSPALLH